jgi:HEAT repeat protein
MQPYKGLQPYTETDKDNFFGREAEKRILIDKILTHKLTFLFAASGVGKSSLLRAAVLPELKQPGRMDREPLDVIYYNDWVDNPLNSLKKFIVDDLKAKGQLTADYSLDLNLSLAAFFHICTAFTSEPLVIILDQFEEFFNYQRFSEYYQPVISELAAAIHDRETETVFVISMREDFALELNAFKDYIPTFLIDNFYRLEKLTLEQARLAVVEPVAKVGFVYEPALLDKLLEDLVLREQRERGLKDIIAGENLPPLVEPPHLQMICMQLWDLSLDNADKRITQAVFDGKGGTEGLLKTYFLDKMKQLSGKEEKLASAAFDFLVNRHGTKMPRSLPDLAELIRVDSGVLAETLDKLDKGRILRQQLRYGTATPEGILWYELYHDFFSKPIYAWNEAFKTRHSYHLRLGVSGLSDVEVYRGKAGSYDFSEQQGFVHETVYKRSELEADKLFVERSVGEFEGLNTEVVGLLPLADRIAAYLANGDLDKALVLARRAISDNDMHLSEKIIKNLGSFRSVETFGLLGGILQTEQNNDSIYELKEKIIEGLDESKAPKQVVPFLIVATKDRIQEIRMQAAKSLGQLGSEKAIEPLIALLKDEESYVRRKAAESLGQLGSEKAIEPLIALLKDKESSVRMHAAKSLGKLGTEKAIEPLIALLKDKESSVRMHAAKSLGQLRSEKAIEPLIALLKDKESSVRMHAAKSLGKLGTEKAIEPLIALLKDKESSVRMHAAKSLVQLGTEKAIEPLIALLKDKESSVRMHAAKSLVQLGTEKAIEPLIALLKDKESSVRMHAAKSLGQLGTEKAIEPLIALLKDKESSVREYAAESLGQLGTEKAIEPLIALLKDKELSVRKQATASLVQLGSEKAIEPLIALLKDKELSVRKQATASLVQLGSEKAIEPLIALLKDKESSVRMHAAESLGQLGSEKAIEPLIALLKDKESSVRMHAAESLGQLGSEKAIEPLIALLKDKESSVREYAAESLGQLGAKQAIEPVIALLNQKSILLDLLGFRNLRGMGDKQIAELLKLFNNSEINSETLSKKSDKSNSEKSKQDIQQLFDSLEDDKIYIQKRAIESLGKMVANVSKESQSKILEKLTAIARNQQERFSTQKRAIESLGKIATDAPKESQAKILEKLTAIASNQQELFGTRMKALESLGKLGTEAAANNIIQIVKEEQGEYRDSYVFTAYQALQDTKTPIALKFFQQELDKLTQQKQQWRNQRDKEQSDLAVQPSLTECKVSSQLDNEKRWQYGYWEIELGYAIAQHDPADAGIEMLKHPLANVRQGAWFGIAKIGVPTIKILKKINQLREKSTKPHFRHAAFRALDKSLITIEVYGTQKDVQALTDWLPEVSDKAVIDRIEFTLTELEYRLEQSSTTD